jgi:hypothetical protein
MTIGAKTLHNVSSERMTAYIFPRKQMVNVLGTINYIA